MKNGLKTFLTLPEAQTLEVITLGMMMIIDELHHNLKLNIIHYWLDVCSDSCAGDENVVGFDFAMTTSKSTSPPFFLL